MPLRPSSDDSVPVDAATSRTLEVHNRKTMLFKKRLGTATGGLISTGGIGEQGVLGGDEGYLITVMSWKKD